MKIPKKIKVCGHWFTVNYPYAFKERGDLRGQCDLDVCEIRLADRDSWSGELLPESIIAENFLHELLHIADGLSGHKIFKNNEPAIVGISEMLFHILRDNKLRFDSDDAVEDKVDQ